MRRGPQTTHLHDEAPRLFTEPEGLREARLVPALLLHLGSLEEVPGTAPLASSLQLAFFHESERRAARLARAEQQNVREATAGVLDGVTFQQDTLRQILTRAYGDVGRPPTTELDVVVELLAEVVDTQEQAVNSLGEQSLDWPRANTAFHIASGRMQQTLESLRALLPPKKAEDESLPPRNDSGNDEGEEGLDTEGADNKQQPVSADDFQAAMSLQSLPVPNYTSAEIMAEEAANQQQRAKRKAARAGARVEKNW